MKQLSTLIALAGLALARSTMAADIDWSKLPPVATAQNVTFDKDIAPIFKESCARCHGDQRPRAGLVLTTLDGVMKGTKDGAVVKAGDSANSVLVKAISQLDPKTAMPPKPRARRGGPGGPGGTNAPDMHPPDGAPPGPPAGGGGGPEGGPGMGGPAGGPGGPGGPPRAKPLTAEQVGLVRAWIDQGAK